MTGYVAYLISGHTVTMTEQEFKKLDGKTGLVHIPSCGEVVNMTSISHIVPAARAAEIERGNLKAGRLHDGTRVALAYGRWVDAGNPEVTISLAHYPEAAKDQIMTDDEWERLIKPLATEQRREAFDAFMAGRSSGGLLGDGAKV